MSQDTSPIAFHFTIHVFDTYTLTEFGTRSERYEIPGVMKTPFQAAAATLAHLLYGIERKYGRDGAKKQKLNIALIVPPGEAENILAIRSLQKFNTFEIIEDAPVDDEPAADAA